MTDPERSDRGAGGAGDAWARIAGFPYPAAATS